MEKYQQVKCKGFGILKIAHKKINKKKKIHR